MPLPRIPRMLTIVSAAVLVVGVGIAWFTDAFASRTHIPAEVVYEYRSQFQPGQLAPGWILRSVGPNVEDPTRIVHRVEVPAALAGELVMMGNSKRGSRAAEVACPASDHPIWTKIGRGQNVEIELHTEKGPFETISCRAFVR